MIKVFSMAYDFDNDEFDDEELANFVATHRVKYIRKEFFVSKDVPCWTFVVEYDTYSGRRKIKEDTKDSPTEALDIEDEILVDKLKIWRHQEAIKRGIPLYIVITNDIIQRIATKKPMSKDALSKIQGMGGNKMSLYGEELLKIIKEGDNEQGLSDIQPMVQIAEPDSGSEREVPKVDEIRTDNKDPESLF